MPEAKPLTSLLSGSDRIGLSQAGRLLVVAYTERDGPIRIVRARESTPGERREYESQS